MGAYPMSATGQNLSNSLSQIASKSASEIQSKEIIDSKKNNLAREIDVSPDVLSSLSIGMIEKLSQKSSASEANNASIHKKIQQNHIEKNNLNPKTTDLSTHNAPSSFTNELKYKSEHNQSTKNQQKDKQINTREKAEQIDKSDAANEDKTNPEKKDLENQKTTQSNSSEPKIDSGSNNAETVKSTIENNYNQEKTFSSKPYQIQLENTITTKEPIKFLDKQEIDLGTGHLAPLKSSIATIDKPPLNEDILGNKVQINFFSFTKTKNSKIENEETITQDSVPYSRTIQDKSDSSLSNENYYHQIKITNKMNSKILFRKKEQTETNANGNESIINSSTKMDTNDLSKTETISGNLGTTETETTDTNKTLTSKESDASDLEKEYESGSLFKEADKNLENTISSEENTTTYNETSTIVATNESHEYETLI